MNSVLHFFFFFLDRSACLTPRASCYGAISSTTNWCSSPPAASRPTSGGGGAPRRGAAATRDKSLLPVEISLRFYNEDE
jgi:hypothetical protein